MRFLFLAALLCDSQVTVTPVDEGLAFLARHQNEDGSWGGRPAKNCGCGVAETPKAPVCVPVDPSLEPRVLPQLTRFADDDPRVREEAQKEFLRLGSAVVPSLYRGIRHSDPEVGARCRDTLERLRQTDPEARRRWAGILPGWDLGGEVRATSLAILCLLGAGYTQLSKDERNDPAIPGRVYHYGDIVKNALRWLLQQQDAEGSLAPHNPVAQALAVLALSEAYGMTMTPSLKEPAERGLQNLLRLRSDELAFNAWKALALMSAETSELPLTKDAKVDVARRLHEDSAPRSLAASAMLPGALRRPADDLRRGLFRLDPEKLDPEELQLATMACYRVWGRHHDVWKAWHDKVHGPLKKSQVLDRSCARGSWKGTSEDYGTRLLVSLNDILALERTYQYANVFGASVEAIEK